MEPSEATLEQAAQWYALLRSGHASDPQRSQWREWLQACDEHRVAWRYVEDISHRFTALQQTPHPLQTSESLMRADQRVRQRRRMLVGLAAVAGTGLLGSAAWHNAWIPARLLAWSADYRAGVGMPREIELPDGSRIWLNSDSACDVDYSPTLRRLVLLTGELFIATAADPDRPFVVDTAQGRLRALGTRFNLRLSEGHTQLAVYEGAVEVTPRAGRVTLIQAGEQVRFTRERVLSPAPADPARQAWTHGVLLAQDISLREVVQELRRHRHGHLAVAEEIADLKVYGSFPVWDTDRALAMLTTVLPIRVRKPLPWWTRIESLPATQSGPAQLQESR